MSVTHVDTVADAVIAGLERPDVHGPVNVADRGFVRPCDLLADAFAALGLPTRIVAIPLPVAWTAARIVETAWSLAGRRDPPPLTAYAVSHLAGPFILDVSRLERSLGIRSERHYRDAFGELAVAGTDALAAAQAS